jgi:hypothetical protein
MNKLILPALGAALAFGVPQVAGAQEVQLSQLMIIGQPGQTGNVNRTLPSGSPGIAPSNLSAPPSVPFSAAPPPVRSFPFVGERGDLNFAEPEAAGPAERDANGRLQPSIDRAQARFAGERGPDGKLLPTFAPQQAQAQTTPQAPAPSDMRRSQPPSSSQPGMQQQRRQPSGAVDAGQRGMSQQSMREVDVTKALNALSAEGFTPTGRLERVGNMWQTTAMKDGRQVTVQIDPQTDRIMAR